MRRLKFTPVLIAALLLTVAASSQTASGGSLSPISQAPGLPLKPDSVRFAVVGDSGSGDRAEYETAEQMQKFQRASRFSFVIMLGDNLYGGSAPGDYENRFARPYKSLLDSGVKFYASLGNHDNVNETAYAPFNMNGNRYYTYTQGEVQFFVLDSNYVDGPQLEWLKRELAKSAAHWKIAYFHHPLYSSGKRHGSDADLRTVLEPLFVKYGMNVVLSGHDHVYERIVPQNGILYFVMGSSGQLRSGGLGSDSLRAAGFDANQSFMAVEIAGDEFYFQAISRTGQTVDSGVFKRQGNGTASPAASTNAPANSGKKTE
jgi:3',5'-cyclic AMP phosphodiesterase CpdA